jgi:L-lactate dehydrogenase complex protein LldG
MVQRKQEKTMSKAKILKSIARNKPAPSDLPDLRESDGMGSEDLLQVFMEKARSAGAEIEDLSSAEAVKVWIGQQEDEGKRVVDLSFPVDDPDEADVVVIRGQLGVAENGAVWINEHEMQLRNLPFVAPHLALVLEKASILPDMHRAYREVDLDRSGFGVFIAGPSKTADIEQSLVIGAHGPVEHTILLYGRGDS